MENIEQLYQMYFKDVYYYLRAISKNPDIAEDLTQETFFQAMKQLDKFRGDCNIRVWLCQIAKYSYYKYCKKNKQLTFEKADENIEDKAVSLERTILDMERNDILKNLVEKLDEPGKTIFHLRVIDELSFRQIGEAFQRSENWARVTFYRTKCNLAKKMEEIYGKDEL